MENQIVKTKSSGNWWKVLLGIGAGWFLFSAFKNREDALPSPGDNLPDNDSGLSHGEQYEIDLWKYAILKSGSKWPKLIAQEAKSLGITFAQRLNDIAVAKYVEKGHNEGIIEKYFQDAIRRMEIKMRQSKTWMAKIAEKADQNGISMEQQMERAAIWSVLNNLMKPYNRKGNPGSNPSPSPAPSPSGNRPGHGGYQGVGAFVKSL
jgi:hypothetical protein